MLDAAAGARPGSNFPTGGPWTGTLFSTLGSLAAGNGLRDLGERGLAILATFGIAFLLDARRFRFSVPGIIRPAFALGTGPPG